jgi:hypothetical protein
VLGVKVLYWHRNGFCLWLKRLEAEKFAWPSDCESATQMISLHELEWLLEGFDLWAIEQRLYSQSHPTPPSAAGYFCIGELI